MYQALLAIFVTGFATALAVQPTSLNATTEATCRIDAFFGDDSDKVHLQGNVKVMRDAQGLLATYHYFTDDDAGEEITTRDVEPAALTKAEINGDEAALELARLADVNKDKIESALAYKVDDSDDGAAAILLIFKDKKGKTLGKAGFFGWTLAACAE